MSDSKNLGKQSIDEAMLKEHELLRQELLHVDGIRFNVLVFTVAAVGTIIGFMGDRVPSGAASGVTGGIDYFVFGISVFALLLLATAQVFTIYYSQRIRSCGDYIRIYIESKIEGLKWETRLFQRRKSVTWGTSQPLAIFYSLLAIAITTLSIAANSGYLLWHYVTIGVLTTICLICSCDLVFHISPGWHFQWPSESDATSPN